MDRRTLIITVIAVCIVVIMGVVWYFSPASLWNPKSPLSSWDSKNAVVPPSFDTSLTYATSVPSETALTKPTMVFNDANGNPEIYMFAVTAEGGKFSPSRIVVAKGMQAQLNLRAVDAKYDVAIAAPINAYVAAEKGYAATIGFLGDIPGVYVYKCEKFCNGGTPSGELVVLPK